MNKKRFSMIVVLLLIFNLFTNIIDTEKIVRAQELQQVYSDRYTYNEVGVEYIAKNNLTVILDSIEKVESTYYDTYTFTLTQRNDTSSAITECALRMYFHDKESETVTAFLGKIYPGDSVTKQYKFKVAKENIPWAISYQVDFFDRDLSQNLKWDITPDQYKGMSSNTNLTTIETNYGNTVSKINVPSVANTITINPIPENSKATVSGAGTYNLNYGDNTIKFTITSEMGTSKEYSIIVRRLSSNANLSRLSFSDGTITPAFDKDITEYTVRLDKNNVNVGVYPSSEDSNAKISYKSYVYVKYEPIVEKINVTAEDGTTKEYVITFIPPSDDSKLKGIILNDGEINFTFNPSTTYQKVTVDEEVTSLKIEGITNNPNATVESGNGTFELKEGKNEFRIKVLAENKSNSTWYTLEVNKTNNNTNLKGIYFSKNFGDLIQGFDPNKTEYDIELIKYPEDTTDNFRFYASAESYKSKVSYEFDGEYENGYITLKNGKNKIKITVISEQGDSKVYTVNINYREAKNSTKIESIVFDQGVMEPAFDPNIKDYTITVPRDTNSINVLELITEEKVYFISNTGGSSYSPNLYLNNLDTMWTFKVIAEDGVTVDYYNFNIVKTRSDDSSLGYLGINGGQIYPEFNPNIKEYSVTVHSSFEKITIGASTSDYRATLSGIGEKNINFGNNKFNITVTAEDGSKSNYTLNVYRNNPPVLTVNNITSQYGDEVDLLKGIKATDVEDGDITIKVKATPMQGPITYIGTYDIRYYVEDSFGESVTKQGKLTVTERIIPIREAIGKDRYNTAVKLSQLKHSKSDIAVIVNGAALADGLAVTPLATYYKAPILLTTANSLPKTTVDELKRLGVKRVIIAGGKGVVSDKVESELRGIGVNNIERLAGSNRYDTSLQIAKYIDKNCYDVDTVAVVNGYGEADALSISAVAGKNRMAIIMSSKNNMLPAIEGWLQEEKLVDAYIVGGSGVLTDDVLNKVNSLTQKDIINNRLGGKDRYHTNSIILKRFYGNNLNTVYVAKGSTLVDALAAGATSAIDNGPVMLVPNQYLTDHQYEMLNEKIGSGIVRAGGGIPNDMIEIIKYHLRY